MDLYGLIEQSKITTKELDRFAETLSSNPSLKDLCESVSNKIDEKKAFALAKIFSETIVGIDLDEYAPDLIEERNKILKKDTSRLSKIKQLKEQIKTLKLIDEDLALYIFEKKTKVTMD